MAYGRAEYRLAWRIAQAGAWGVARMIALLALLAALLARSNEHVVNAAPLFLENGAQSINQSGINGSVLSPFWEPAIQRWGNYISTLSEVYGFHPDFIAAVIKLSLIHI